MLRMAKVKIDSDDQRRFAEAAAALGVSVEQWLADAGRAQASAQAIGQGQKAARVLAAPLDADTAAALDAQEDRTSVRGWAIAARLLRESFNTGQEAPDGPADTAAARHGNLDSLWTGVLDELAEEVASRQQRSYLRLARPHAINEDTVLLAVPNTFTRDVIESRLRPAIAAKLSRALGRSVEVAVTVAAEQPYQVGAPGTTTGVTSRSVREYEQLLGRPEVVRQFAAALVSAGTSA